MFIEKLKGGDRTCSLEEMMEMMTYFKDDYALDSLKRQNLVRTRPRPHPRPSPSPNPNPNPNPKPQPSP